MEMEKVKGEEKKLKYQFTLLLASIYPSQIHEGSWEGGTRWDHNIATRWIRNHTPHCCSSIDEARVSSYHGAGCGCLLETTQVGWVD